MRPQIQQALGAIVPERAPDMTVTTVQNAEFGHGSAISVLAAHEALSAGEPVLLMDADVLYDTRLMQRLLESRHDNVFLLDRDVDASDPEPVKLCVRDGVLADFDKTLLTNASCDTIGESVGFFRLSPAMAQALIAACQHVREADEDAAYEQALRDVLLAQPQAFGYEDVTGLPWIEIDFPDDIERAEQDVVPALDDRPIDHG